MKLFFPNQHYDDKYRRHLFALLKPFVKENDFTDEERIAQYGISERDFIFVNNIDEADIVILTMSWLYYKITNKVDVAIQFIKNANSYGKRVLVALPSDFGIDLPKDINVIVVREQGYKSKLSAYHHCIPVFVADPLKKYYDSSIVFKRNYNSKPTVGFCGQADGRLWEKIKELLKISVRNLLYFLRIRYKTPHQLIATKSLRYNLLKRLKGSSKIKDNFIIRKQHRAGVEFLKTRNSHRSTIEFFDNIKDSDYVLCARGVGNFSVRFYETLAMGRIPVFVNTDCILPHDNFLNWKDHVVWVE
ncbi:exostosin domain-containing protein, partial [Winogradskyella sp.]